MIDGRSPSWEGEFEQCSLLQMDRERCRTIGVQICWWMIHESPCSLSKWGSCRSCGGGDICRGKWTITIAVVTRGYDTSIRTARVSAGDLRVSTTRCLHDGTFYIYVLRESYVMRRVLCGQSRSARDSLCVAFNLNNNWIL